jgi:hypothetical protein
MFIFNTKEILDITDSRVNVLYDEYFNGLKVYSSSGSEFIIGPDKFTREAVVQPLFNSLINSIKFRIEIMHQKYCS